MSGLAQFVAARGLGTLQEWCEEGYKAVARIDEDLSGKILSGDASPHDSKKHIYHPDIPLKSFFCWSTVWVVR